MSDCLILSIQVGLPRLNPPVKDASESWTSGIFKSPVHGPVRLGPTGLQGDGQADLKHHGGPDRAILAFSISRYGEWQSDFNHDLPAGAFGENLTLDGIDEDDVCLGDIWECDSVQLEVSQPRIPCYKLSNRLSQPNFHLKVMETMASGWYCRTLREGTLEAGKKLRLVARPYPDWTIRRAFREFVYGKQNREAVEELAGIPALSELWRTRLQDRIAKIDSL